MRALVCSTLDGLNGVAVGDLPDPEPTAGEVRIRVHAAGVNFPDLLTIQGLYQDRPDLPFVPGVEVAGEVLEVGSGASGVQVGDRVYASIGHGGYAEQVVVSVQDLFHVPDGMPYEVAAVLPLAYGTAYHALVDRAELHDDETLLVLGAAGGVGLAAVQIGATLGAKVIAAVSSDDKAQAARSAGAAEVLRYDDTDLRDAMRSLAPAGADVVFDPVGGDVDRGRAALDCLAGPAADHRLRRGRHPEDPGQLAAAEGRSGRGGVLGAVRQDRARAQPPQLRDAGQVVDRGPDHAVDLADLRS